MLELILLKSKPIHGYETLIKLIGLKLRPNLSTVQEEGEHIHVFYVFDRNPLLELCLNLIRINLIH